MALWHCQHLSAPFCGGGAVAGHPWRARRRKGGRGGGGAARTTLRRTLRAARRCCSEERAGRRLAGADVLPAYPPPFPIPSSQFLLNQQLKQARESAQATMDADCELLLLLLRFGCCCCLRATVWLGGGECLLCLCSADWRRLPPPRLGGGCCVSFRGRAPAAAAAPARGACRPQPQHTTAATQHRTNTHRNGINTHRRRPRLGRPLQRRAAQGLRHPRAGVCADR